MTTMFDSVDVGAIPADAQAVAGYVGGKFLTFPTLQKRFAGRHLLSIAVASTQDAECLDVEPGDAPPELAAAWVKRQLARGVKKPVIYSSRDTFPRILELLAQAGIKRSQIRIWSAHYTHHEHICSPACGAKINADATQWTNKALGRNLDQSLCVAGFFGEKAPPKPWPPTTLKHGSRGNPVKRLQRMLNQLRGTGKALPVDGVFGASTERRVKQFQRNRKLKVDGVVGHTTGAKLIKLTAAKTPPKPKPVTPPTPKPAAVMSVRATQEALRKIGWPIKVDDKLGPLTKAAIADFQRGLAHVRLAVDGRVGAETAKALMWSVANDGATSAHFKFREFADHVTKWIRLHRDLVLGLEALRAQIGHPVGILSGFRDPKRKIGAANSQHHFGNAMDPTAPLPPPLWIARLGLFSGIGYDPRVGSKATAPTRHLDVRHVGPNTTGGSLTNPSIFPDQF